MQFQGLLSHYNAVGYQNIPVAKFGVQSLTFKSLTETEANMTLGDIKTNSKSDGAGTYVSGWNPDGDRLCFIDANAKMGDLYYYVPQWWVDEAGWEGYEVGWYIDGDTDFICQNSVKVGFGNGVIIKASSATESMNPALLVDGQVKTEGKDIPVAKFSAVGACRPSRVYLGDISTNSESDGAGTYTNGWNPDGDRLCFIDSTAKMGDLYYYVPQWWVDEAGWEGYDVGWYIDGDTDFICQNEIGYAEAGSGFIIKASSAKDGKEPVITIGSALAK